MLSFPKIHGALLTRDEWFNSSNRQCLRTIITALFKRKLRDELLNGEIFDTILEARFVTEAWRKRYNTIRPNRSLGYRARAPEAYHVANA
jgi:hypothetical protein